MFFGKDEGKSFHFGMSGDKVDAHLMQIPFLFRKIAAPSKVLDIGCTGSPVALQLAMLRYNVTGIDYNDYGKQHANLKFIKGDFNAHDFGKEKFDIVIAINSLEHFGLRHYNKSEYLDKQNDVKAMTKVKEIMNSGGQLIFSCNYGISDLITISGKPFVRVYDDKALDVMLSTFDVKAIEYYIVSDSKNIRQVEREEAKDCRYYLKSGSYAFACISAIKQ
ncbi:MAG: class I SAM-dependent methyltransferase [Candidatus Micrarchaeaceae archaeon]